MDEIILTDDMKKESRIWLTPMILCFFLSIIYPILMKFVYQGSDVSDWELILLFLIFMLLALFSLFAYLYAIKYKVAVTADRMVLKTLFKNIQFNLADIKEYHYKRYMKSVFYQFTIYYLDRKVLINTRYYNELDNLLRDLNNRK